MCFSLNTRNKLCRILLKAMLVKAFKAFIPLKFPIIGVVSNKEL